MVGAVTGPVLATDGVGATAENFRLRTTSFSRAASVVKFCEMRRVPPKSTTAM